MTPADPRADPSADPSADPRSDSELMAAVAAGDREAFAAVYARFATPLMAFLHHLSFDRQLAEDATQETFVRAWQAASRFRPGAPLAPWLYRIAQRTAWTAGAARARRGGRARGQDPATADPGLAAPGAVPVDARARDREVAEALRGALRALSEPLRVAFVLVRMEGMSYEDAAQVLEVPEGTVKSRVAAAETALRGDLRGFL